MTVPIDTPAAPDYAAIKGRQQKVWASGDYHVIVVTTMGAGPEPGTPVMRGKLSY